MLFVCQELLLPKLSQKSHVNWYLYLEQFYWKIHVNICTFQGNKSIFKKKQTNPFTVRPNETTQAKIAR